MLFTYIEDHNIHTPLVCKTITFKMRVWHIEFLGFRYTLEMNERNEKK